MYAGLTFFGNFQIKISGKNWPSAPGGRDFLALYGISTFILKILSFVITHGRFYSSENAKCNSVESIRLLTHLSNGKKLEGQTGAGKCQ